MIYERQCTRYYFPLNAVLETAARLAMQDLLGLLAINQHPSHLQTDRHSQRSMGLYGVAQRI